MFLKSDYCLVLGTLLIQGLLLASEEMTNTINYVCPTGCAESCSGLPCENITYYASNPPLGAVRTAFVFLPGTHWLEQDFKIINSSFFSASAFKHERSTMISCNGSSGFIFKNVYSLALIGLTISNCSTKFSVNQTAALVLENVADLILENIKVVYSFGHGILAINIYGNSTISFCQIQQNHGRGFHHGGNMLMLYKNCSPDLTPTFMAISHSIFSNGSCVNCDTAYNIALASGLSLVLSCTHVHVTMYNVTMANNYNTVAKGYGGNLFIHFFNDINFTSNYINIRESRFLGGSAGIGGGICTVMYTQARTKKHAQEACDNHLTISDSEVSRNSARVGGGWLINLLDITTDSDCPSLSILVKNVTFSNNSVKTRFNTVVQPGGASIYVLSGYTLDFLYKVKTLEIILQNITIQGSFILGQQYGEVKVAAIYSEKFMGKLILWDVKILNNAVSGIAIIKGRPHFKGTVVISNNTGLNGGGMSLCDSSYLTLTQNSTVVFTNNHAKYGGGIYAEDPCIDDRPSCFYQYIYDHGCLRRKTMEDIVRCYGTQVIMEDNVAEYTGNDIFGGSVAKCSFRRLSNPVNRQIFYSIFKVPRNTNGSLSAVSSSPFKVCLCFDQHIYCSMRHYIYPVEVYPGEMITMAVVLVGQLDGAAAGIVSINNSYFIPITNTTSCKELAFRVNKTSNSSANVLFGISDNENSVQKSRRYSNTAPLGVKLYFKKCPIGFEVKNGLCDCLKKIRSSFICHVRNRTIERIDYSWIGYNSISNHVYKPGLIYCLTCPLNYCKPHNTLISVSDNGIDSDSQCSDYRTGVVCGMCQKNYSITIGSNICRDCREFNLIYAFLIIMGIITFHMMIVIILFLLDLNITDGTLSGLLFYANIVNSKPDLFHFSHHKYLTIALSWFNLDIGFSFCMYKGLDMYIKSWLMFTLPPLTWLTVILLILLSKKYRYMALLLGGNSVKVLATLIELSFYQTIQSCIIALSCTDVRYPGKNGAINKHVWLYDANIGYLEGKHIPLFLTGCLFSICLLAYTCILLFIQPLRRFSHWSCLRWVHKMKPLIDAYTAPHVTKTKCQFWTGFLLLLRVVLSVCFSTRANEKIQYDLVAIIVVSTIVLILAALLGGVYKKTYLNLLNLSFFANLIFLSLTTLVHLNRTHHCFGCPLHDTDTTYSTLLVIVALLTAAVVLLFHVYKRLKMLWRWKVKRYNCIPDMTEDRVLHSRTE